MKKIISYILKIIPFFLLFIVILIINSANHLLHEWGGVNFSTALYQLNSPLQGANMDAVDSYLQGAFFPTIFELITFTLIWYIFKILFGKFHIIIKGRFKNHHFELTWKIPQKTRRQIKYIVICLGSIICIILLWQKCDAIEVQDYFYDITHASTIFEDEYVDPHSVDIHFEKKKNLIYIYMESMETTYLDIDSGGGKTRNYIPNLKKLAEDNISFSDTDKLGGLYQNSGASWTMGSLLASMTGVPYKLPIGQNEADEYTEFLPGITGIGEILAKEGYHNYFMCGSGITFGGREVFLRNHGNYEMFDYFSSIDEGIVPPGYHVFWGIEDSNLYLFAQKKLNEVAQKNEPFNFTMLTVDTHQPEGYLCKFCETKYPEDYGNVIACADKQITQFIEWIQLQDWYENTVIIISGDHLSMNKTFFEDLPENYSRKIYNCFLNIDLETKSGTKNRTANIMDMFPTTLVAMGAEIEGDRLGLGTNLFSDRSTLSEEIGREEFNSITARYSKYYDENFIKNNPN